MRKASARLFVRAGVSALIASLRISRRSSWTSAKSASPKALRARGKPFYRTCEPIKGRDDDCAICRVREIFAHDKDPERHHGRVIPRCSSVGDQFL